MAAGGRAADGGDGAPSAQPLRARSPAPRPRPPRPLAALPADAPPLPARRAPAGCREPQRVPPRARPRRAHWLRCCRCPAPSRAPGPEACRERDPAHAPTATLTLRDPSPDRDPLAPCADPEVTSRPRAPLEDPKRPAHWPMRTPQTITTSEPKPGPPQDPAPSCGVLQPAWTGDSRRRSLHGAMLSPPRMHLCIHKWQPPRAGVRCHRVRQRHAARPPREGTSPPCLAPAQDRGGGPGAGGDPAVRGARVTCPRPGQGSEGVGGARSPAPAPRRGRTRWEEPGRGGRNPGHLPQACAGVGRGGRSPGHLPQAGSGVGRGGRSLDAVGGARVTCPRPAQGSDAVGGARVTCPRPAQGSDAVGGARVTCPRPVLGSDGVGGAWARWEEPGSPSPGLRSGTYAVGGAWVICPRPVQGSDGVGGARSPAPAPRRGRTRWEEPGRGGRSSVTCPSPAQGSDAEGEAWAGREGPVSGAPGEALSPNPRPAAGQLRAPPWTPRPRSSPPHPSSTPGSDRHPTCHYYYYYYYF
ncbi:uncharacterized protein [Canis lupus baileyi]|uniref:uncharacterized protein n=1 Tax=Canis lupus baileyi TaxID=143281 RepID=UPI003B96C4D1